MIEIVYHKKISKSRTIESNLRMVAKMHMKLRKKFPFRVENLTALMTFCMIFLSFVQSQQATGLAIEQSDKTFQNQLIEQTKSNGSTLETDTQKASSQKMDVGDLDGKTSEVTPLKTRNDLRRPIWALAHMVNSIKELHYRLGMGANAIESDVTFSWKGEPLYTYHGPPCDCWRHCYQKEDFRDFLSYVRHISIDNPHGIGQNLSLLFLDLKLDSLDQRAKADAGIELARAIVENLFLESPKNESSSTQTTAAKPLPPLNLILSVNHVQDTDLILNFVHYLEMNNSSHLMKRIGFDVGMNDDLQLIESMWRRLRTDLNLWQGDGYTNCLSPFYNLERLTKAVSSRDKPTGFPAKVYHWTIDLHDRIRESLRLGVDAVMTNHPERVLSVLQEPEMIHHFRLASRADDPFKKLTRDALGRLSGEGARHQRSAVQANGGLLANLADIFNSWLNYMREIPFLSLPTTFISPGSRGYKRRSSQIIQPNEQQNQKQTSGPALVKLENQSPEYSITQTGNESPQSLKTVTDTMASDPSSEIAYEGPHWYTTLASNLLVSMVKILLPS